MMRNKYKIPALLFTAAALSLTACDDWTDPESVKLHEPDITQENPKLYGEYLKALREYKDSADHKAVYVWFDNSQKTPTGRIHHLNALPDSIDVVDLMYPDNLADWELNEIKELRRDKGTKVTYTVDYDAIKKVYDDWVLAAEKAGTTMDQSFNNFLADSLQTALAIDSKYNYDGLCISYNGKLTLSMTPAELQEYTKNENTFMDAVNDWLSHNPNKLLTFKGNPQYLADSSILDKCSKILVPCDGATNVNAFSIYLEQAAVADNITAKLGIFITGPKAVDPNKEVGYVADGSTRIAALAEWMPRHHSVDAIATGIYNPSGDFYNVKRIYNDTRTLISSINPPVK